MKNRAIDKLDLIHPTAHLYPRACNSADYKLRPMNNIFQISARAMDQAYQVSLQSVKNNRSMVQKFFDKIQQSTKGMVTPPNLVNSSIENFLFYF